MQIVIAWTEVILMVVKPGDPALGRPHTFADEVVAKACMWVNNGSESDRASAERYAAAFHPTCKVFVFNDEKEPLNEARRLVLAGGNKHE